jgi:acyl-coenzyme A thioesterase PaaI-like protein
MTEPIHDWLTHDHGQQPGSRMCFACGVLNNAGLHITFFNDGYHACRCEVTLDDRHQSFPGIAHGGIVAAVLDETMGRALISGDPDRMAFTAKMEVRYRQNTPLHTKLFVTGRIEKDRGRLVTAVGKVKLIDGTITAEATCVLANIPPEELNQIDKALAGWQVYPQE